MLYHTVAPIQDCVELDGLVYTIIALFLLELVIIITVLIYV